MKRRVNAGTSKAAASKRREVFVNAYLSNGRNATEAAVKAGFSPNSARTRGLELVKDSVVAALIEQKHQELSKITGLDMERTLREVARLAYSDIRKAFRDDGSVIPITELDDDTAAMIGSVETLEEFSGSGEDRTLSGYTKKLKLWDKNAALEKAMKFHGAYERDNAQQQGAVAIKIVLE